MEFTALASGSTGNCALVSADGTGVLIDAGISLRRITSILKSVGTDMADVAAVLITHEHADHIRALGMLTKHWRIPVYATAPTADCLRQTCPQCADSIREFALGETLCFGTISVRSFPTSHDAAQSVGYRFDGDGRALVYATDTGIITPQTVLAARGCQMAVLEANHDVDMLLSGRYPYPLKQRILSQTGHLSNKDCGIFAAYLASIGTRRIVLAHLSQENNTPRTARETVEAVLRENGAEAALEVAPVLGPLGPICV